tara:strand:+ start:117 stop:392 length:276 start_codon:yes stop_codon:yes gene_type:complete
MHKDEIHNLLNKIKEKAGPEKWKEFVGIVMQNYQVCEKGQAKHIHLNRFCEIIQNHLKVKLNLKQKNKILKIYGSKNDTHVDIKILSDMKN